MLKILDADKVLLKTVSRNFGPEPFRFYNSWIGRQEFGELVRKVKGKEEKRLLEHEFSHLEEVLEGRDFTEEEGWTFEELKRRLRKLDMFNQRYLQQKSRSNWAAFGDDNSKFFHGFINKRKAANYFPGLMVNGVWESKPEIVKREVLRFFRDKFKESMKSRPKLVCYGLKKVSQNDADSMLLEFSVQEVKEAVFDCGADKALSLDGFNYRFIKTFWDLFEHDFVDILHQFHRTGRFSRGLGLLLSLWF
ncbi:uncharacterized protein LOC110887615 [Helianthus annuus]|uniref:uncharacterized protein LOC110887615 n=1 Tax=Helianthus annuus TaxID=4232 RepID=UPI000B8F1362|nr:uncharacterized protein LOC110887615 [Helianthus annuus]